MKLVGLILVFGCPFLLGAVQAVRIASVLRREKALIRLVDHAEEKIRRDLCPRDALFCDFEDSALSACAFTAELKRAARNHETPLSALEACKARLNLHEKAYQCMRDFFFDLGKLGYESQLRLCRECREELERQTKERETQTVDQVKLWLTLGAAAGALGVLILI